MEYTYYVETGLTPEAVERRVGRATAAAIGCGGGEFSAEPISVIRAIPSTREMIREVYGFAPDIVIGVQLDKFNEDRRGREAQAVDVILDLLSCRDVHDMYVDYLDGNPVLLRRGGVTAVESTWVAHRPWVRDELPEHVAITSIARI